ncbi:MAG: PLP-dependent aminotransferase family protein [Clostridiaceae bacterium]
MFSNFNIDKKAPVYVQLKDYLRGLILKGMFQKDEKLPSTRELSVMLGLSRNTVNNAYESLQDEGLINIVEGKGTFVFYDKLIREGSWEIDWSSRISEYGRMAEGLDIIKHELPWKKGMISFKSIAPDESLFDVQEFKRCFLNRISIEGEKILNYGYAQGYRPLINFLTGYMKGKGVETEGKKILITNGFTEGFDIVLSALTTEGDRVLCENPTHNTSIKIMKLHKLEIHGVTQEKDGINLAELKEKLGKNSYKLAYLVPSYHNPTGVVMSAEKRLQSYNILKEYNVPIVEDGFNEELRYSGGHVSPMASLCIGGGVIYIGSFSKILFPGVRMGWVMADEKLIGCIESIKRSRNIHTSAIDQAVLFDYFENGGFERYIKKARKFYKEKYEFAAECARKYIPCKQIMGSGGLHIFIEIEGLSSRKILERCYDRGVVFTAGDIFFIDGKGENTFRLGFSRVKTEDIEKGFKIIGDAAKELLGEGEIKNG